MSEWYRVRELASVAAAASLSASSFMASPACPGTYTQKILLITGASLGGIQPSGSQPDLILVRSAWESVAMIRLSLSFMRNEPLECLSDRFNLHPGAAGNYVMCTTVLHYFPAIGIHSKTPSRSAAIRSERAICGYDEPISAAQLLE